MRQEFVQHQLKNGLTVVIEPMDGVQSAAFCFLVPSGVIYEPEDRQGAASVLCDLVMRGAGPRDNRQLVTDLDNLGIERGEGVNSAHASLSGATLASNLSPALCIYADVLRRARLEEAQLEPARSLALQELVGIEDEPRQKVMIELRRRHYPQPWGRSTYGTHAGLTAVTHRDLRELYGKLYYPNGTILGVAGKVNPEEVVRLVEQLLGEWEPRLVPEIAAGAAGPTVDHVHQETTQTQIGIAYPSVAYGQEDYYRACGAVGVLSGGMSSRLFTEVREKRGLCYAVYATHHTLRNRGSIICYAGTSAERAQETLDVTLGELRRLSEGIAQDELDRVKARMKSSLIMQQESTSARAGSVARDWYFLGRARTLDEVHREVEQLTCTGIVDHLRRCPPRDFTILTLGPQPLQGC